jgi:L-fuconolactonase
MTSPSVAVVDTHAHIISSDPVRYPFAPQNGQLPEWLDERSVDAELLLSRMSAAGVDKAVLVQYSSAHGFDNAYVLDTAARFPEHFVAVCTIDGRLPEAPDQLTTCVRGRGAAGVRIRAPVRVGPLDWLTCEPLWQRASELQVPVCVHFMPHDQGAGVPLLRSLLDQFPHALVVLDHVGNPPWQAGPPDYGLGPVSELARSERVWIKFATINLERLELADIAPQPALGRLLEGFGSAHVMWGSDAPNTPGDYTHMLARMRAALSDVSPEDQAWILAGTALSVYPQLRRSADAGMSVAERPR